MDEMLKSKIHYLPNKISPGHLIIYIHSNINSNRTKLRMMVAKSFKIYNFDLTMNWFAFKRM